MHAMLTILAVSAHQAEMLRQAERACLAASARTAQDARTRSISGRATAAVRASTVKRNRRSNAPQKEQAKDVVVGRQWWKIT